MGWFLLAAWPRWIERKVAQGGAANAAAQPVDILAHDDDARVALHGAGNDIRRRQDEFGALLFRNRKILDLAEAGAGEFGEVATDLPVGTLAEKHGFTNDKLFHRLFRERFHTTPLQLRKAAREKGS